MLESLLKGVDYKISTAKNGAEALALARKYPPDLIITDILMPVMDGFTLCKEWRKDEVLKKIPFIFYTAAYTSPQDIKYALRLGADRFLIKPQEPSVFLTIVKQVLDESEMGLIKSKPELEKSETESLREYNAVLFRKLEDKLIQTEQADKKLKQYAFELEQNIQKLKQSEENLRQTHDYLDKLINYANAPIIVWNPLFKVMRFNHAFEYLTGYSSDEIIGQKLDILLPENSKKESIAQIEQTLKGEVVESLEIPVLTKSKEIKIILCNAASIYDSEGKNVISTIAQGQDITERKRAEELLKHNSSKLVKLSESLSSLGSDFDLNINQLTALCGELLSAKCSLYSHLDDGTLNTSGKWQPPPGFTTREAVKGQICYDLISENKKEAVLINDLSKTSYVETDPLIKSYAIRTFLGRVIRSEGKPVGVLSLFYQDDFQPTDEDKRILGIIASGIGNEDNRKQLTQALLKSERLLNKTEMISKIGGWEYDVATKRITWTKEAYRIYGVPRDFDPNKADQLKIFVEPDQKIMEKALANAINRGEPYDLDLRCKSTDGNHKWVRMIGSPVFENGRITKVLGNLVDITERKNNEEALRSSESKLKEINATKDKFFSIIAHDLKNPFNGILGFSNILKEEAKDMDLSTIQEYADMINRAATQVFRLLENLLSWARVQQGQIPFNPTTLSLKEIADEAVETLLENAQRKKIRIVDNIPENFLVTADADMLKTILRNLVSNAVKFTAANGEISLSAEETADYFEVSIKDNGKGMTRENAEKLFKIDTNYITRGTEEEEGTGLGLILCKEFVDKHHGNISVESDLDRGSTFRFTLAKQY